jgi:hypothetical protein
MASASSRASAARLEPERLLASPTGADLAEQDVEGFGCHVWEM